ncbi:unnamed protein product [Plasmodium vivax]|uniref:(malaria parasite P. vivax) hypothetical protein n=1 Tax=Plasmodium vivax TaxID=5855 RepID=A0A8S4HDN3_PLAVI|nr:unnamed protein product [Plasmodium vivax]
MLYIQIQCFLHFSQIKDEEQIPYKFKKLLDEHEEISNLQSLFRSTSTLAFVPDGECKKSVAQLARNIRLINSEYSGNPDKRCRDINYWFSGKIKTCQSISGRDISSDSTTVFNDIKWIKGGNNVAVCPKELEPYKTEHVEIMKELDDFCEIRNNIRCDIFKNNDECLKYNRYIKQKKEDFTRKMKEKCGQNICRWDDYRFGDYCTLNDMDLTFREINCAGLYKKEEIQKPVTTKKGRSTLEIGFFIIVSFILFYLFILFLEKFTPVGSIISRFRRRKYDLKRIFEREDDDRYSLYHSEKIPADSENKRYYIEYGRPNN